MGDCPKIHDMEKTSRLLLQAAPLSYLFFSQPDTHRVEGTHCYADEMCDNKTRASEVVHLAAMFGLNMFFFFFFFLDARKKKLSRI